MWTHTRAAPAIQDFNGFLKVLRVDLEATEFMLLLLHQMGGAGATYAELDSWARPKMRANLRRTHSKLVDEKLFAHHDGGRYFVTHSGIRYTEQQRLADAT